jgi:hypothetical protein
METSRSGALHGQGPAGHQPHRKAVKLKPQLDYDVLAELYEEALDRIELLEEYAQRMLKLCDFRKYEP